MKLDPKTTIIIVLVFIIGILIGMNLSQKSTAVNQAEVPKSNSSSENGKIAKEYQLKEFMGFIKKNASKIQTCYLGYLEKKPKITEGDLKILAKVDEDGKMSAVKITQTDLPEDTLSDCVVKKFENLYLGPPPHGINRFLSHTISFKSVESAEKELKEKAARENKMPLILPNK